MQQKKKGCNINKTFFTNKMPRQQTNNNNNNNTDTDNNMMYKLETCSETFKLMKALNAKNKKKEKKKKQ
jgi:hypothetical protein